MRVTVLGAGIAGCASAAFLAEAGADVTVVEPVGVASGASGRNQGLVQHPLDEALAPLFWPSLALHGLDDREPDGLLVLGDDHAALAAERDAIAARFPELEVELLEDARTAEPAVAPGLGAVRVVTGHVVGPREVTEGWWARAQAAGAQLVRQAPARADHVLVCTGAATPGVTPLWGVIADLGVRPAQHALEALGVADIARPGGAPPEVFTLVGSAVGSAFLADEPDPAAVAPGLFARATRYLPGLGATSVQTVRACPRPLSPDGRPVIGPVAERVHVCTGHGPWGITLGPESARLAVAALLHGEPVPEAYAASRLGDEACAAVAAVAS